MSGTTALLIAAALLTLRGGYEEVGDEESVGILDGYVATLHLLSTVMESTTWSRGRMAEVRHRRSGTAGQFGW